MNKPIKTTQQYFTLIELLVVISILAILMSLLSPALRKAIYKSKTVTCSTNLKKLGLGIFMYADDNNDSYPHTCKETSTKGNSHMCRGGTGIKSVSASHSGNPYYTSEELWPYYGGQESYISVNCCPHTPVKALLRGFRNKMSTYNTFYWMQGGEWQVMGAMKKLGDRWRGDKRFEPKYLWYNVVASDGYAGFGGIYGSGPHPFSNHPAENGDSADWYVMQSYNGYRAVNGPTSTNSLIDDGSVVFLNIFRNVNKSELGGFNLGAVPIEYGTIDP
jgi:prepilin-type N-terminal cleavage/methylation domain-containing protein